MKIDFLTREDLKELKNEIVSEVATINQQHVPKKWLRSAEVREMLGISPGTLQNMRIQGHIPFTKIGGTLFYNNEEIENVLNFNKSTS